MRPAAPAPPRDTLCIHSHGTSNDVDRDLGWPAATPVARSCIGGGAHCTMACCAPRSATAAAVDATERDVAEHAEEEPQHDHRREGRRGDARVAGVKVAIHHDGALWQGVQVGYPKVRRALNRAVRLVDDARWEPRVVPAHTRRAPHASCERRRHHAGTGIAEAARRTDTCR
jgi:hypothetical protein